MAKHLEDATCGVWAPIPRLSWYLSCCSINIELQRNLIIQGTMHAGAFVVVLARHYGGHASTAGQIVIATSLVGLVAIPTLLTLGFRWIH